MHGVRDHGGASAGAAADAGGREREELVGRRDGVLLRHCAVAGRLGQDTPVVIDCGPRAGFLKAGGDRWIALGGSRGGVCSRSG